MGSINTIPENIALKNEPVSHCLLPVFSRGRPQCFDKLVISLLFPDLLCSYCMHLSTY